MLQFVSVYRVSYLNSELMHTGMFSDIVYRCDFLSFLKGFACRIHSEIFCMYKYVP